MPKRSAANYDGQRTFSKDATCRVTLYPNDPAAYGGGGRDISGFVTEVVIEEGINQSSLITTITIRDGVNMIDDMRIAGNERIDLAIYYPNIDQKKEGRVRHFYISDVINFSRHLQVQTYQLICISEEAYLSSLKVLRRSFEGGIGDEIQNILENDLHPSDGQSSWYFIKRGGGQVKGIYPNKNPIQAINWLMRNANANGAPHYFFESLHWEQLNKRGKGGFVFGSYHDFIDESLCERPITYKHTPYRHNEGATAEEQRDIDEFEKTILKISTTLGMSKFNQIPEGAYGSSFLGVDLATKKTYSNEYAYKHVWNQSLNAHSPFATTENAKFGHKNLNEYQGRRFYTSFNSKAFDGDVGNYNSPLQKDIGSLQKSIAKDANINHLSHNITVEGNFDMWPGRMIEIRLPKAADATALENREVLHDEVLSGKFMITNLIHTFKDGEYLIKATCQADSSSISLDKAIPGTGE